VRSAEQRIVTAAVLAGNTLVRPLLNAINRAPFDERNSKATYEVHVITEAERVGEVRDRLIEALDWTRRLKRLGPRHKFHTRVGPS
jgi:putative Mg2+ transporter-C (MgtC) family protein